MTRREFLLLLQKIAEKYQYKDFEFKHDIR